MFYVMHCGGLPFNGETIAESSLGGSETAAYYVARELVALGHHVTLFTNSEDAGMFDGVKYEFAGEQTKECPLGERFTFYAENTPHDICIIQRNPHAFSRKWASKQNFLWMHDLAVYPLKDAVMSQMWNVDKILCVSEYHKAQVAKMYGLPEDIIAVVNNGVDLTLYDCPPMPFPENERHVFYSSRPERGLLNLVGPNGIMERLKDSNSNIHLHVCGYENTTPQMKELYEYLWARCDALPNVTNHGSLKKSELAALQKACDAWVYPTEFEEVSCITAMEAMAAGCAIVASDVGALSETCARSGAYLLPLKDGRSDLAAFVAAVGGTLLKTEGCPYTWAAVAEKIVATSGTVFGKAGLLSLAHHFMRHSDIPAFNLTLIGGETGALRQSLATEYDEGYRFYRENTYAEHYKGMYQYCKDIGVIFGPEDATHTARFMVVANMVAGLPAGSRVLDYGCAHGHYTVALARRFPQLTFVGADLAQSNVDTATKWAKDEGLSNVEFDKVSDCIDAPYGMDLIIAAEVIEHVGNPQEYIDTLSARLTAGGKMVITVPYGPWEAQGYREHGYWRAHLHHFERQDLLEMLGHHPDYKVVAAPSGTSQFYTPLGSYIASFSKPTESSRSIDYSRKIKQTMPDQTISVCMIVKDAEQDIARCLASVAPFVQEIIIGIDESTRDATRDIIRSVQAANPLVAFDVFDIPPVMVSGFADARNATISKASGDWVLWIDSDEVLVNGGMMPRTMRNSMYNGYAMKQHHFSADPVGVVKVDLPCRLFRNGKGIKFFGVVHEHPEIALNEGLGPVSMMHGAEIIHYGYKDETVRRKRFDRNLPLLERDRKENPSRLLGKFLWLRDLAQLTQYEAEAGGVNREAMKKRIPEGIKLWEELLESKNYRIVLDALPYYSQLAIMQGGGLDFSFAVNASWTGEAPLDGVQKVEGYFANKEHALALMNGLAMDKLPELDRRYL